MLDIDMEFKRGILITRLRGVLSNETTYLFDKDVIDVIKNNGIKFVLLNVSDINYIDHYGFESINNSYRQVVKNGGKMILCGMGNVLKNNLVISDNLYQVSEEVLGYELVSI